MKKAIVLPDPWNIEFKQVGLIIFDISYTTIYLHEDMNTEDILWLNSKNQIHREDGPAQITSNGIRFWIRHNKLYRNRKGGPVATIKNGTPSIWVHGRSSEKNYNDLVIKEMVHKLKNGL